MSVLLRVVGVVLLAAGVALACTSAELEPLGPEPPAVATEAPARPRTSGFTVATTAAATDRPQHTATLEPTDTLTPEPTVALEPPATRAPEPEPTATATPEPPPTLAPGEPTRTRTPTPEPTPTSRPTSTPAPIDMLTPADLSGLLPSLEDIEGLATETSEDSPVIKRVTPAGVCEGLPASECVYSGIDGEGEFRAGDAGFIAGYKRHTWAGGLLNVYSLAGTRVYFTLQWVSMYETREQARAQVEALKGYDREAVNRDIGGIVKDLKLPVAAVNIISVVDGDGGGIGDYAAGKEYAFSGSSVVLEGREARFVRGRTVSRVIVVGVYGKTGGESALALSRIVDANLGPFLLEN